ncbi:hypothetical protein ABUW04_38755 [Streptacidiphilus sp. N1-10]|uniref:HEXXH motif domain-containing protein n=2 Tax=Streptacidiphilus TaxID=228398 RepID=A0ABV6UZH5_9ACTN
MFRRRCPVGEDERVWIEESLHWLTGQFGEEVLRREVLLPQDTRFPRPYRGGGAEVEQVVRLLFAHLGVDRAAVSVEVEEEDPGERELLANLPSAAWRSQGAAGHYQRSADGSPMITLTGELSSDPVALVAVLAHELGHHRLLGEHRIPAARRDGEPLTDLLTVFFGTGHFNANVAHRFSQHAGGWQRRRLGYLTQPMFGYALARYAWLRGETETEPAWVRLLDTNPRGYLREGLRYLRTV